MRVLLLVVALNLLPQTPSVSAKPEHVVVKNSKAAGKKNAGHTQDPAVPSSTFADCPANGKAMGEKTSDADKKEHDGESNSGIYVMNEIPHTFDWLYLIYTLATVAAVIVSWAALITIRAQSILMKVEQRAWVSVEKPSIVDTKSSQLKIRIKLRNTGRTPAKGVVRFMEITLEKPEVRPNLAFREPVGSNTIIFPNGEIAAYQTRECDEETVNQVNSGALSIWVHGKIVYHDIFERKHWVTFCIVRVKGESFKAHTEYNAIDGERKKNFWGGISRFNKTKQT